MPVPREVTLSTGVRRGLERIHNDRTHGATFLASRALGVVRAAAEEWALLRDRSVPVTPPGPRPRAPTNAVRDGPFCSMERRTGRAGPRPSGDPGPCQSPAVVAGLGTKDTSRAPLGRGPRGPVLPSQSLRPDDQLQRGGVLGAGRAPTAEPTATGPRSEERTRWGGCRSMASIACTGSTVRARAGRRLDRGAPRVDPRY